jgi:non-canonical (house-cleaning) NTP pyrophosphatase
MIMVTKASNQENVPPMDVWMCCNASVYNPARATLANDNGKVQSTGYTKEEHPNSDQGNSDNPKQNGTENSVSNATEPTHSLAEDLDGDIENYKMSEDIVPPFTEAVLPPFEHHQYPNHGTGILLVTPTCNKFKTKLFKETFESKVPQGQTLHILSVAFQSGVGEQPYNEAGLQGAYNRITNALRYLDESKNQEIFRQHQIGTVIVASVENYIQLESIERPTDYGVVVIHNATTDKTVWCLSQGVTVPSKYLDQARQFGFGGNSNHGRVPVGEIFAAHVQGIDHANWHEIVTGHSRYDILTEAVQSLQIPW